ncbi:methyltransferase family protein [Pseudonocardia hierapolitana]|uniref:Methyltransferase family protein n=1 Tax=Pseudonocardia hierapolitana TaxID=1128676 RepID=A0A561T3K9_9PSEU|nr:methyltransferase domain-containing protein [Pseudonocardia hierapolitana]TWF81701.1 methyltransferase family protein [Pseudonocardia hierapolitana]
MDPDPDRTRAFGEQLLGMLTGGMLTMLIGIGHRTGLFEAAARGPATSSELAERAGLHERYVREWLGAMVTGGIMEYDPADGRHTLPAAHAALLTGATSRNVGPTASSLRTLGSVLPQVERCFTEGGGVPIAEYAAVSAGGLGETWRHIYDEHLVDGFLGRVPGLHERLRAGVRVLDLGCGTGHAVNVMARAFPESTFDGLDIATDAIADAEAERAAMHLPNAAFAVADAAALAPERPYDVITAFDAIHDQAAPEVVLRRIHDALDPDGLFVMIDTNFATRLEDNLADPYAPLSFGISLLFCVPTSIATGGSGLGAMWGREQARRMLADAGFTDVQVFDTPRPQNCMYVCRAEQR